MKRLIAICFLCLLLFNIAGYRLLFHFAEQKATAQLVASLEQDQYQPADLITLTVPLSLPYQTDWEHWEKARGEIEIDGITYQYVQRKVTNGQLVLQCLPNKEQAKIESARDRFFELANSFQDDSTGKNETSKTVKVIKPSYTDFDDQRMLWVIQHLSPHKAALNAAYHVGLSCQSLSVMGQPPEARS